jgi:hypothetical protein
MQAKEVAVLEALQRTQRFLDTHADIVGNVNASAARRNIDANITVLAAYAVTQDRSARGGRGETARQRSMRSALRFEHMRPIAEIAKRELPNLPEFTALRMPPRKASSTRLVSLAGGMADAATPHTQVLLDGGLLDGFIERLRAAADELSRSLAGRTDHVSARVGSSAGLGAQAKKGRSELRVLNSLVKPKLGNDVPLNAEWRNAITVRPKPGPAAGATQATTTTPVVTPVTPPVHSTTSTPVPTTAATPVPTTAATPVHTAASDAAPAPAPAV